MQELILLIVIGGGLLLAAVFWGVAAWSSRCIRRDMTWTDAGEE